MFENVTEAYNKTDATIEIIIMLAVAFLLGMLVHWAFSGNGECHHHNNEEKKPVKKKVVKKTVAPKPKVHRKDNLRLIEGIGPKIEKLLNEEGIESFADLARANRATLDKMLEKAGPRFQMHDSATWSEQAKELM